MKEEYSVPNVRTFNTDGVKICQYVSYLFDE